MGVAPSNNVTVHYTPPCYGHDEPTISFISSAPNSGSNDKFQIVLPSSSSSFPQGNYYSAMWFGGVVYDNKSLDNQAFLELQFYPASPTATGPNSGSQDCSKRGSFSYLPGSTSSNQWFACAIAWAVNPSSSAEYAAIGLPVDAHGGADSILVMNSDDIIQVAMSGQAKSTSLGLQITVSDNTIGSYSVVTLQNSTVVLSPFYSTAASGNVLQWGAAQPGQVSFAYEIGHTLGTSSCGGQGSPGDGRCWSYWPGRWADSGQNQLFVPEMGDLAGTFPTGLAFSSSQGGDAEINSSVCHSPSSSNTTNCEYPYYMFQASRGAFTFGTTDVPGATSDFGGANQFPTSQTVNTVSMIQAAHANLISPSGAYAANATYAIGQDMKMSTIVPGTTSPVSVWAFINGTAGSVHIWDTGATGWNYVIDFGAAPNLLGRYYVNTVATFADGSTVESNTEVVNIFP
ncbi:MAG: hypothetical protein OK436_01135 [Thaumarchaeota archaeon]|nr:hypothetical protein [Nitrososphaerota archaeon]